MRVCLPESCYNTTKIMFSFETFISYFIMHYIYLKISGIFVNTNIGFIIFYCILFSLFEYNTTYFMSGRYRTCVCILPLLFAISNLWKFPRISFLLTTQHKSILHIYLLTTKVYLLKVLRPCIFSMLAFVDYSRDIILFIDKYRLKIAVIG